jgi:hypothetical protein
MQAFCFLRGLRDAGLLATPPRYNQPLTEACGGVELFQDYLLRRSAVVVFSLTFFPKPVVRSAADDRWSVD